MCKKSVRFVQMLRISCAPVKTLVSCAERAHKSHRIDTCVDYRYVLCRKCDVCAYVTLTVTMTGVSVVTERRYDASVKKKSSQQKTKR